MSLSPAAKLLISIAAGVLSTDKADLILLAAEERDRAFGRELGRVLADELYHVFAKTIRHGSAPRKITPCTTCSVPASSLSCANRKCCAVAGYVSWVRPARKTNISAEGGLSWSLEPSVRARPYNSWYIS